MNTVMGDLDFAYDIFSCVEEMQTKAYCLSRNAKSDSTSMTPKLKSCDRNQLNDKALADRNVSPIAFKTTLEFKGYTYKFQYKNFQQQCYNHASLLL